MARYTAAEQAIQTFPAHAEALREARARAGQAILRHAEWLKQTGHAGLRDFPQSPRRQEFALQYAGASEYIYEYAGWIGDAALARRSIILAKQAYLDALEEPMADPMRKLMESSLRSCEEILKRAEKN